MKFNLSKMRNRERWSDNKVRNFKTSVRLVDLLICMCAFALSISDLINQQTYKRTHSILVFAELFGAGQKLLIFTERDDRLW